MLHSKIVCFASQNIIGVKGFRLNQSRERDKMQQSWGREYEEFGKRKRNCTAVTFPNRSSIGEKAMTVI